MPGLYGRVGGYVEDDAAAVASLLRHFPFYRSAETGDARAWLGWVGVGDPEQRLAPAAAGGPAAAFHGDATGGAQGAAARLARVRELSAADPLGLAQYLDGSFVAAVCDPAAGSATVVGDVFGHHRLYWCVRDGVLHFACELKGLLRRPGLVLEADDDCLRDLWNYGYPLGERTALKGVRLLPPASVLRFDDGRATVRPYWAPVYAPGAGDTGRLVEEGYELFRRSFAAKVDAGRDLVLPVSGGLDSRLLLGEATARGHRVTTYTYGHAASREARVARAVMNAAGAPGGFYALDDFPEPARNLLDASWFVEGMTNLGVVELAAVNRLLLDLPRDALFVNGIYGGPTNFSSIYHRREDLVTDLPLDERVRRVGRKIFAHAMDTDGARYLLRPDFARRCADAYWPVLRDHFAPCEAVSPVFGHQMDAFLVAQRLFRFMNQVDLNRYYWEECLPLTSFSLYRFYLTLPEDAKFGRRLHRQIVADRYPALAAQENFNSRRTVLEELAGAPPVPVRNRGRRLRYLVGRLSGGRLSWADPESYQALDHFYRRSRAMQEFVGDHLADPHWRSGAWFDQKRVLHYLDKTRRGSEAASRPFGVLAWELWLRQLESRSREAA